MGKMLSGATVAACCAFAISVWPSPAQSARVAPDPSSAEFQDGSADRSGYEAWFATLNSAYREGALFWAGQRSLSDPQPCSSHLDSGADWAAGCTEARRRLSAFDVRRKTEPQYWYGWNKTPSDPLASNLKTTAAPTQVQPPVADTRSQREPPRPLQSPEDPRQAGSVKTTQFTVICPSPEILLDVY